MYFSFFSSIRHVYPNIIWQEFNLKIVTTLEAITSSSMIYVWGIAAYFYVFDHNLKKFFVTLASINTGVLLTKIIMGKDPYFLFNNAAIDTSFICCVLPFVITTPLAIPMILVALLTKTSSGIIGISVAISGYVAIKYRRYLPEAIAIIFVLVSLGIWSQGYRGGWVMFNSSGRFHLWSLALEYFNNEANQYLGTGAGTFHVFGPAIQMRYAVEQGASGFPGFFWMHNDWLQILFETGYIGLGFTLIIFFTSLWKSRKSPELFSSLLTIGVLNIIQMGLRWLVFTVLICYVLKCCRSTNGSKTTSWV